MSADPTPPWLDERLLAAFNAPSDWGYLGADEHGRIAPRPVADAATLSERLAAGDGEHIGMVWTPTSKHLQTVYQPPELAEAVITRDTAGAQRQLRAAGLPSLALVGGTVAAIVAHLNGVNIATSGMLILLLIVGIHLMDSGPQRAWAAWQQLRALRDTATAYRHRRDATLRFALWQSQQRIQSTMVCCISIGICFFAQMAIGDSAGIEAAGLDKSLVAEGEWWRLFTAAMVHADPIHVIFNCMALYALGSLLERTLGGARLCLVLLVSCLGSSCLSWLLMPNAVSVGASGAILGLGGCLLVCAWLRPELRQVGVATMLMRWSVLLVFIGIVGWGFIDNAGHLGGWLTGMALAPLVAPKQADAYPPADDGHWRIPATGLIVGLAAWTVWIMQAGAHG